MLRFHLIIVLYYFLFLQQIRGQTLGRRAAPQTEESLEEETLPTNQSSSHSFSSHQLVEGIRTEPILVEPAPAGDPVITVLPTPNTLQDLLLPSAQLPPRSEQPSTPSIGTPAEGNAAEFFGEIDPGSFCDCTDTIPSTAFSCQEIRFRGDCDRDEVLEGTKFCRITCGRCSCCPSLVKMASRRGLDIFRLAARRLLELEGPRSVANVLEDPSFTGTVFMPTNDAFARFFTLLNITKEEFLNQPRLLNQIITYHVLVGPVLASYQDLLDGVWGNSLLTQNSASFLALEIKGDSLALQGIGSRTEILVPDLYSCRGLIHIVENLLIPFSTEGFWE